LRRGSIKGPAESMEKAKLWLKRDVPILIFPEGTRSQDGSLGEFKLGAFKLASEEKVPLVPIALTGTRHIIEKGTWLIKDKIHVQMKVLPPISAEGMTASSESDARTLVREKMKEALLQIKHEGSEV
jgi:1-acyl-sn-glycerol-3-phosphate acyltransferase